MDGHHGDERNHGVLQGVDRDDHRRLETLGMGRPDVVLAEDIDHARAKEPSEVRRLNRPEGNRGENVGRYERPHAAAASGRRPDPRYGEPVELDREDVDENQGQGEIGNREAEHHVSRGTVVHPRVAPDRGDDAERYRDSQGKEHGRGGELEADGEPFAQHLAHGTVEPDRAAQVSLNHVAEPDQVLLVQGLVEMELLAHRLHRIR